MDSIEHKLGQLGLELPEVPRPVAAYVPAKQIGDRVYVSGQMPFRGGEIVYTGEVGDERSPEEGYEAAKLCALNALAVIKSVIGSLDRVEEFVHVRGYVNCTPDFGQQPEVIDGASELLGELFGNRGAHARAAIGVSSLPRDATVEVELVVRVRQG